MVLYSRYFAYANLQYLVKNDNIYVLPVFVVTSAPRGGAVEIIGGALLGTSKNINHIRIYYECENRIEKSVPRITVWHHEACRVMTNGDPEGRIFRSYPHTNNRLFSLLTIVFFLF